MEKHEDSRTDLAEYEKPRIVDYGSLVELTRASTLENSDSPSGTPNTAYSVRLPG